MANEHPDGSVKSLWQGQDDGAPDVADCRRRAEANESRTRRRRLVVGVSIVNNVAICAALAWLMPPSRPFVAVFFIAVSFAQVQALADVDERGHGRVARAERAADDRADVRGGDGLWGGVAGVPVILVARVQDEPQVGRDRRADERRAVHDLGDVFEALRELDVVDDGVDGRESAEDLRGREAGFEGGVFLGVEGLRVRHAAGHPEDDDAVGGGGELGGGGLVGKKRGGKARR